ncbi:MAG: isoprenyl transferase [Bacteroidota bacterium]|nr:isoprenyl transferase [Bacteroidota bacterium]
MSLRNKINNKKMPVHVAIIMDGNGRWAKKKGFARVKGHEKGVDAVRETVEAAAELGIRYLTLYAFSTENWKRPKYEIEALMNLLVESVNKERKTFMENNIRLLGLGDLKSLPEKSYNGLNSAIQETSGNTGLQLVLALSYSSRWEIVETARRLAEKVRSGEMESMQITEKTFRDTLPSASIPDPDLLIRTSGEYRISNFLLWQLAYTELYFTPVLWPEFNREDLYKAILDFQGRERRFGMTSEQIQQQKSAS